MDTTREKESHTSDPSAHQHAQYLPKEPLDLPHEPLELASPHAHASHQSTKHHGEYEEQYADEQPYTVKTLLAWSAPGRPYRAKGKEYFVSVFFITLLLEIIVFLFGEYLLMLVILSFSFLTVALSVVPPHSYHYRVSTEGVSVEDHFFLWQELYDFYFKRRENQDVLHIRTKALIPGELTMTLGDIHREQIKTTLLPYLPYREVIHQTFMEKSGNWIAETFPLEKKRTG